MKILLLQILALLCAAQLHADEAYVQLLKSSAWMTPEMCSLGPPDDLFQTRVGERPRKLDVSGSEAGQDAFFEAYADNLAAFSDQHYPLAARIRKPLQEAFASVFEFISAANGHNGMSHYHTRLPARVEWQIYHGCKNNFLMASGRYSLDDLRTVARLYQRAYSHGLAGAENPDAPATHFEAGIRKLQEAEGLLSEDAIYHFRAQMMAMFGQFLGR